MKYSSNVFGASANDGTGYATRISVNIAPCSGPAPCDATTAVNSGRSSVPDSFSAVIGILLGGNRK